MKKLPVNSEKVYFNSYFSTMSTRNRSKINQLLALTKPGTVLTSAWLVRQGYSLDLLQKYKNSHWFASFGNGAMIRTGDTVTYFGAVYSMQNYTGLSAHPGGKTALALLGRAHFLNLGNQPVTLIGTSNEKLPRWFNKHVWDQPINYHTTSFLPPDYGLSDYEVSGFTIKVSSAARAILEELLLAETASDLLECYQLLENLSDLRPQSMQQLLEFCQSVKVKRMFVYMAEKIHHQWFDLLDLTKIELGSGKRSFVKNGVYISRYQITVPKELANYDSPDLP